MSFDLYATTAHAQRVAKWSLLAIPPNDYSVTLLCRYKSEQLRALAYLWGVTQDGSKHVLDQRIIRRHQFRKMLSQESEESLARKTRTALTSISREAGIFHSWLSRKQLAAQLIVWLREERARVRREIANARHERLVRQAARNGFCVPGDNLERYGIDSQGNQERMICGVSSSRAARLAPEAIAAAKTLSQAEFLEWTRANPEATSRLVFIETGILGDDGALLWKLVQRAFTPAPSLPLFDGLETGDCSE